MPSPWMLRFFRWFCHPDFQEDIEGDLLEMFQIEVEERGKRKADWIFFFEVISLIKLNLIRSFKNYHHIIHYGMYKNYFKIAWRSLLRQKLYSSLNISGLAVGLTCFLLIFLYIQHELSYDRFYPEADRIYRIYQRQEGNLYLDSDYFAVTPAALATTLEREYPEVNRATTMKPLSALLSQEEDNFWEEGLWADNHFFEVFALPFVQGNPKTALEQSESIVLSQSLAQKIFGSQNPIGQVLKFQNEVNYTVTGVVQDFPTNSSFQASFFASIQSFDFYRREMEKEKWDGNPFHTFLKLAERGDPLALEAKLPGLIDKYVNYGESFPFESKYYMQPLMELHLENKLNFDIGFKGNARYIYLFSWIAIIVLLLACVNYMNLAVARSIKRAREVGVRKVMGALRGQLIGQFLSESVLIAFLALFLALGLTQLMLPVFGYMLERPIELNFINPWLIPGLTLLVFTVGIFSGSYPAFVMSTLNPVMVLKGRLGRKFSGLKVQQCLIIGQYAASIVLIMSSLVIYRQFQYIQNKELGYDTEHILTIPIRDQALNEKLKQVKNECLKNSNILAITNSVDLPTSSTSTTLISKGEARDKKADFTIYINRTDYHYLDVFGIELIAGRNFSPKIQTDARRRCILNETAVKALGWTPEEALGKQFNRLQDTVKYTVIGVAKDFHMNSMHLAIEPLMLTWNEEFMQYISVKIRPSNLKETINYLEGTLAKYSPYPVEYQFLDEQFDQLYKADRRLGEMFAFFTILSILIASLGLFGLAAFSAEQRTKEIGIRKVLGASIQNIVTILSKDFLKMVMIGFLIAVPIAWYFMNQWLQDFVYRIEIQWWMFVLAGLIAVMIAVLTISFQSIKAAMANPVESLRNE